MSDYDPNRLDPNQPPRRDVPFERDAGFNWNWVLGGAAAIVLLLIGMSLMSNSERTAEGIAPSQTTGQSSGQSLPAPNVAPAEKMSPRPVTPNQ